MATIWVFTVESVRDPNNPSRVPDIKGYEVAARDGNIGKIEEVVRNKNGGASLVVDTGFWIFEKKRMIPAGVVNTIDDDHRIVYVTMTKDEIKQAPDYDEQRRNDESYRRDVGSHYEGDPVGPQPGPDLPPG